MNNILLNTALANYIMDSKNPDYNFILGNCYENMGQLASAASFYLRTAEYGKDDLLSYEALLKLALCFHHQGSRVFLVKGLLLRAISLIPYRPEAYFLLSRTYEINKDWQEAYSWAILGEELIDKKYCSKILYDDLKTDVEYPGSYGFTFERAVTGWWIGLYDESIYLFRQLKKIPSMQPIFINAISNNLKNLGSNFKEPILYDDSLFSELRFKFKQSDKIVKNYSQCYQDMFVLSMLDGKKDGKFLEIGCGDPFYGNNTALLEKEFGWTGISIDINLETTKLFSKSRKSRVITSDATKLDYNKILEKCDYDYLQIDCDPAITSFNVLLRIPFITRKFAVISFEHDYYCDESGDVMEKSRKYLESFGYKMVVNNIAPDKYNSYEDWWVHPDLVSSEIIEKMQCISDSVKKADDYMLEK